MEARKIDTLIEIGWWVQVSPLANAGSGWICGIYKRGLKTGNWLTEFSKKFNTPHECYQWAEVVIDSQINKTIC